MTTLKEMIAKLQKLAKEYGENTEVYIYDEYTANEGWDYEEQDLICPAGAWYNEKEGKVELYMKEEEEEEEEVE